MVIFFIKSCRVIGIIYENLLQCLVQPHHQPGLIHRRDEVSRHIVNLGQQLLIDIEFHVAVYDGIYVFTVQGIHELGARVIQCAFIGKAVGFCIILKQAVEVVALYHTHPQTVKSCIIIIIQALIRPASYKGNKIKAAFIAAEQIILCPLLTVLGGKEKFNLPCLKHLKALIP